LLSHEGGGGLFKKMDFLVELLSYRELAGTSASGGKCVPFNFSANPVKPGQMWGWQGWYTIVVIFFLFFVLFFELIPIEFAMVASVLMLTVAQIITVPDMTQGFANSGILAVACLFIVAEGLSSTGAIDYFFAKLLGNPKTLGQALIRMMIPASFVAAWISSTAVVAILIPVLQRWGKRINQPPSLLMMPMCMAGRFACPVYSDRCS
jgi:di/tricarboxylate transporter